jgi:hypothetical protein
MKTLCVAPASPRSTLTPGQLFRRSCKAGWSMLVNHKRTIARRLGKISSDYFTSVLDLESGSIRLVDPVTPREEKQRNLVLKS